MELGATRTPDLLGAIQVVTVPMGCLPVTVSFEVIPSAGLSHSN